MAPSVKNSNSRINAMSQHTRAVCTCIYPNTKTSVIHKNYLQDHLYQHTLLLQSFPPSLRLVRFVSHVPIILQLVLYSLGKIVIYSLTRCSERSARFRILHFIIFTFIIEIKIEPELQFPVYLPSGPLN